MIDSCAMLGYGRALDTVAPRRSCLVMDILASFLYNGKWREDVSSIFIYVNGDSALIPISPSVQSQYGNLKKTYAFFSIKHS